MLRFACYRRGTQRPALMIALAASAAPLIGCESTPTSPIEDVEAPHLSMAIDTVAWEIGEVWVRIEVVPRHPGDVRVSWELNARTGSLVWRPSEITLKGEKTFNDTDVAQVWGNVPRAYDFELFATAVDSRGNTTSASLQVQAPRCEARGAHTLLCTPEIRPASSPE